MFFRHKNENGFSSHLGGGGGGVRASVTFVTKKMVFFLKASLTERKNSGDCFFNLPGIFFSQANKFSKFAF